MTTDIEAIVNRQRVIEAIDALFIATDDKNWDGVCACFTPVVVFDMSSAGGGPARGRAARDIASDWERNLAPIDRYRISAFRYNLKFIDGNPALEASE